MTSEGFGNMFQAGVNILRKTHELFQKLLIYLQKLFPEKAREMRHIWVFPCKKVLMVSQLGSISMRSMLSMLEKASKLDVSQVGSVSKQGSTSQLGRIYQLGRVSQFTTLRADHNMVKLFPEASKLGNFSRR